MKKDNDNLNNELKHDKTQHSTGTYKQHKEPKLEDTATDVYYKTESKIPESNVAIPTIDATQEAKDWVDDENRK